MPWEAKPLSPQPCYLLDGVGAKPRGSRGEACIAPSHAIPASQQETGSLASRAFNLWVWGGGGGEQGGCKKFQGIELAS